MARTRINKYIASAGLASRRGAEELILAGKVKVNGEVVTDLSFWINTNDKVIVDGKPIKKEILKYYIFHKPAGYLTTKSDPQGRKTIYEFFPEPLQCLNPAGRLDKASSGLLIMTNDGDLLQKLTHPKLKVPKVYRVNVEGKMKESDFVAMNKGIEIEPGEIAFAEAVVIDYKDKQTTLEMTLYQGYNRQIRKMMDALSHPVISLKRIYHAIFSIQGLKSGDYRKLSPKELQNLRKYLNKRTKDSEK